MDALVLITPQLMLVVPVVIGLVSAFRGAGLPDRYAPITAIALGVCGSFVFPAASIGLSILAGISIGLMACGLYSAGKTTVQG